MKRPRSRSLRSSRLLLEALEARAFLSAAPLPLALSHATHGTSPTVSTSPIVATGAGVNLNLTAGVAFTGNVAFLPSPVLDPPAVYSASIDWGDGTSSQATLAYGSQQTAAGYQISGTHTYDNTGNYKITTTVISTFIFPGGASPALVRLVAVIDSTAIVTASGSTSGGNVTLNETTHQHFSATLGTFNFPAPGTRLKAFINWGDGKSSLGKVLPLKVVGLDVLNLAAIGPHTYTTAGTYNIHIVIGRSRRVLTSSTATPLATLDCTAIVTHPSRS